MLGWAGYPALLRSPTPAEMASEHPDAPKQFGIRLSEDTMELVSAIQQYRKQTNQATTLASIVESAIQCHYARLVKEGAISDD
jgi:hypothetical protein